MLVVIRVIMRRKGRACIHYRTGIVESLRSMSRRVGVLSRRDQCDPHENQHGQDLNQSSAHDPTSSGHAADVKPRIRRTLRQRGLFAARVDRIVTM